MSMKKITLVRHTEINGSWKKRCYGVSDVPLSKTGETAIAPIAKRLAALQPAYIIHSGLLRTQRLASAIACEGDWPMAVSYTHLTLPTTSRV